MYRAITFTFDSVLLLAYDCIDSFAQPNANPWRKGTFSTFGSDVVIGMVDFRALSPGAGTIWPYSDVPRILEDSD
jgi:hypothetical protein